MTIQELIARQQAIVSGARAAGRDLTAEERAEFDGLQRQIEGTEVAGRPVLVVEDTSTTGGSVMQAVEAVRAAGGNIVGVATIVDRDTGVRERIEAEGLPYRYAYDLADLGLA